MTVEDHSPEDETSDAGDDDIDPSLQGRDEHETHRVQRATNTARSCIDRRDVLKATGAIAALSITSGTASASGESNSDSDGDEHTYKATWGSLDSHPVPDWYDDAKLGIFIHWGAYSTPGWAPVGQYAEWYPYNMYQDGSPTNEYHKKHYGDPTPDGFPYKDFIRRTDEAIDPEPPENFTGENWDPDRWAEFFDKVGAGYVVPVGEHHDGFAMWDTDITHWNAAQMGPERDVIKELSESVRERGMKFAASFHRMFNYYDPRYNGLFGNPHYDKNGPDKTFVKAWQKKWTDLRDHVKPDLIWWDGDWTASAEFWGSKQVVADYYNTAEEEWGKEVAVNDRLGEVRGEHGDFFTPEYAKYDVIIEHKWEATRGMGYSFGYNRQETANDTLTPTELVHSFTDIVSKNGNLLLDVGPTQAGHIRDVQKKPLLAFGDWLDINGEALFGSDYWVEPSDKTHGVDVRYTTKENVVYAVLFDWPGDTARLGIPKWIDMKPGFKVQMLGVTNGNEGHKYLDWHVDGDELIVQLPDSKPEDENAQYAYTLKVQVRGPDENAFKHTSANAGKESKIVSSKEEIQNIIHRPDLSVQQLSLSSKDNDTIRLDATVTNNGHADSPETKLSFQNTTNSSQIGEIQIPSIGTHGPRGSTSMDVSLNWDVSGLSAGVYQVSATVDPNNEISELSEDNNTTTASLALPLVNLTGTWRFHKGDNTSWSNLGFDDSGWQMVTLPAHWEDTSNYTENDVYGWYRKTITIPSEWEGYDLKLPLGKIDDVDESFFNGSEIGHTGKFPFEVDGSWSSSDSAWQTPRTYTVPASDVNFGGENTIAIRVFDGQGGGGLYAGPLGPIGLVPGSN